MLDALYAAPEEEALSGANTEEDSHLHLERLEDGEQCHDSHAQDRSRRPSYSLTVADLQQARAQLGRHCLRSRVCVLQRPACGARAPS